MLSGSPKISTSRTLSEEYEGGARGATVIGLGSSTGSASIGGDEGLGTAAVEEEGDSVRKERRNMNRKREKEWRGGGK